MLRLPRIAACAAALPLVVPASAAAHQAVLGTVEGTSCGGPGPNEPLGGVHVTAEPEGGGWSVGDTTDARGRFRIDLAPGRYLVRVPRIPHASHPKPRHVRLGRHAFPRLELVYVFDCY